MGHPLRRGDEAEEGVKFFPGTSPISGKASHKVYINEVLLGNNTILLSLDGQQYCYINYNGLNYFKTKDVRFTTRSMQHFNTLVSRSTHISGTGEKYRNKYFSWLEEKVNKLNIQEKFMKILMPFTFMMQEAEAFC